jgi:LacI family repressor for deo operon, udp, cdd, tsx, nupC, and nupG
MSILAVSREAGVSVATVSRVFNFPEQVRPATRERVQDVAQRLGYRPNASAQTLRTQRSRVIGVVLPTLLNPVFAECLEGIAASAGEAGYSIIPMTTHYQVLQEEDAVGRLMNRDVDGVILVVANAANSRGLRKVREAGLPYVLAYNRHARHPCVSVDSQQAEADVVRHLHARGHRHIAMVSGQLSASDRAQQRYRGFVKGMKACGLPEGELLEVPFIEEAVAQLQAFLRRPGRPTALVCSNDLLAIRTVRAAFLLGLAVPRQLSVVGFDGIALGTDLTPTLGTVVQPNREIGRQSLRLLASAIAQGAPVPASASLTLETFLRSGESIADAWPEPPAGGLQLV